MSKRNLILISGLAGTGKTSAILELIKMKPIMFFDFDIIKQKYVDTLCNNTINDASYEKMRPYIYNKAFEYLEVVMSFGIDLIVEMPIAKLVLAFFHNDHLSEFERLCRNKSFCFYHFRFILGMDKLKTRLTKRNCSKDIHKLEDWDGFMRDECALLKENIEHIMIDGSNNSEVNAKIIKGIVWQNK